MGKHKKAKSVKSSGQFRFTRVDTIGANDAEEDVEFLRDCFIDNGSLNVLTDPHDPRRLLVGRTGVGKTALLVQIAERQDRVIQINPDGLSLEYVTNSDILQFVESLGAKLDLFFKLLWRHVFCVELLQKKYHFKGDRNAMTKILDFFRTKKYKQALAYMEKWGDSFWQDTDYRITEITRNLEKEMAARLGTLFPCQAEVNGRRKISETAKFEIVKRSQEVINSVQIRELSEMLDLIDDALDDEQQVYYITVDDLDKEWVSGRAKDKLIRALIETVKDFRKIRHAKILVSLRLDLLERVFRETRDSGFQEEKYESLYYHMQWSNDDLLKMLDLRIGRLVRDRYTTREITLKDLLPPKVGKQNTVEFILARTMKRPREVIQFLNLCIEKSAGKPTVSLSALLEAEGDYSRGRLRSIYDEWYADYPMLHFFVKKLLMKRKPRLRIGEMTDDEIEMVCLGATEEVEGDRCALRLLAEDVVNTRATYAEFRRKTVAVFYRVGLVGVKVGKKSPLSWAHSSRRSVSEAELDDDALVAIHPAFYRVLGVQSQ